MRTESDLIQAIQRAGSLAEQASLVAELDALKASKARTASRDSEVDLGAAIVQAALTPVRVHEHHTASTDWLDDVSMTTEADLRTATNAMAAEASLWFARTSSEVKADHEEFSEQARGMARRLAGKYDEQAPAAAQAFLDYAAFLHRREAASGLDQVQQITAPDGTTKRTTQLPTDVFDTFNDAVDPMNQGVDEMQSSFNAPLLNEIVQNGQGEGQAEVEGGHMDSQVFNGPQTDGTGNPIMRQGSLVDAPSLAMGYVANLDDFRREAAEKQHMDVATHVRLHHSNDEATRGGHDHGGTQGASQYAQRLIGNGRHDDLKAHMEQEHGFSAQGSRHPFVSEAQVTDDGSGWRGKGGDHYQNLNEHMKSNHADFASDHQKAYGDHGLQEEEWGSHYDGGEDEAVHSVNKPSQKVQDHMKNQHGHHGSRVVVSRVVEGASGLPQVEQLVDSQENPAPNPMPQDVMFPLLDETQWNTNGTGDARPEGHPPEPISGDGPKRTGAANVGSDNPILNETANGSVETVEEPTNAMQKAVKAGSRKTASTGTPDFRKGFAFAANWTPEQPLVKKGTAEFEAGLFAGMRENVEPAQVAWVQRHEARGGAFARRIALARKYAATSTDLETMDAHTNPAPNGNTPINGPGTVPPLAGGMDAAAPGGASPYNGAPPYGQPVAPDPLLPIGIPQKGNPSLAFRQRVQAGLLAEMKAQS